MLNVWRWGEFLLPESFAVRNSLIIIDPLADRQGNKTCVQNNLDGNGDFKSTTEAGFALAEGSFLLEASEFVLSIHR